MEDEIEEEENLPLENPTYEDMKNLCQNIIEDTLKKK